MNKDHLNINTNYLPQIYLCYLLEDKNYSFEIINKKVTKFFRPGNRIEINP